MKNFTSNVSEGQFSAITDLGATSVKHAAEAAVEAGLLSHEQFQQILENGHTFQLFVKTALFSLFQSKTFQELLERKALIKENRQNEKRIENKFFGYFSGYNPSPSLKENLQNLEEELTRLKELFPKKLAQADIDREYHSLIKRGKITLPESAERWTLIPCPASNDEEMGELGNILDKEMSKINRSYRENFRFGKYGASRYVCWESFWAWKNLERRQKNHAGILIVPIQFGLKYSGFALEEARALKMNNEFWLGRYASSFMLLNHPRRLMHPNDASFGCPGDEYLDYIESGRRDTETIIKPSNQCPYFLFVSNGSRVSDNELICKNEYFDNVRLNNSGFVSAFIPQ